MNDCLALPVPGGLTLGRILSRVLRMGDAAQERGAELEREGINQRAERLLECYGDRVLRLAYSYLHNLEDAEEVLQDTLIQYLRTGPVFASQAHERAWLLRVGGQSQQKPYLL